jgi:hypothetical protein
VVLAKVVKIDVQDIRNNAKGMEAYGYQSRDPDLAGYSAEVKKRPLQCLDELMANPDTRGFRGAGRLK